MMNISMFCILAISCIAVGTSAFRRGGRGGGAGPGAREDRRIGWSTLTPEQRNARFEERITGLNESDQELARALRTQIHDIIGNGSPRDLTNEAEKVLVWELHQQLRELLVGPGVGRFGHGMFRGGRHRPGHRGGHRGGHLGGRGRRHAMGHRRQQWASLSQAERDSMGIWGLLHSSAPTHWSRTHSTRERFENLASHLSVEDMETATELREEIHAIVGETGCYSDLSTDEKEYLREIRQQLRSLMRGTAGDADDDADDNADDDADDDENSTVDDIDDLF